MTTTPRGLQLRELTGLLAALALIATTACGSGSSNRANPALRTTPTEATGLPAPLELVPDERPRVLAYVEADLHRDGAVFDPVLTPNLALADGSALDMAPEFANGTALNKAAYALYRFNLDGYDRNPQVRHEWSTAPGAGALHYGLADWDANRWRWFAVDPAQPLGLPQIEPFIRADGTALLLVLCTGDDPARLESVRIGSQPPVISTINSGLNGFVPLSGSIDASASSDPDGTIVNFEWDLDGDGDFETVGGMVQAIEPTQPRGYNISLRVTDNDGVSTTRPFTVRAYDTWQRSWGGGATDSLDGVAYDGLDAIYSAGRTTSFGAGSGDILVLKYSLAGEVLWQRTWGTSADEYCGGMVIDSDGNIHVLARSGIGANNTMVLLSFDPSGELLRSNSYAPMPTNFWPSAIRSVGTDLYVVGYQPDGLVIVARLEGDGTPIWMRSWPVGGIALDLAVYGAFPTSAVAICGEVNEDVFLLRLDVNGNFISARSWGGVGEERANCIYATGPFNSELVLGGYAEHNSRTRPLVLGVVGNTFAKVWTGDVDGQARGIVRHNGQPYIGGNNGQNSAFVLGFNTGGGLEFGSQLTRSGGGSTSFRRLALCPGGALLGAGSVVAAEDTSWSGTSGSIVDRSFVWQNLGGTTSNYSAAPTEISGVVGTPSSGVINTGGGSADALLVVRQLP